MSKPIVVLMNWIHMSPTEMAAFAHNIAAKMTSNQKIAEAPPLTPEEINAAADRLELAYANRMNGALAKTEFEHADAKLDELLHEQAAFVNSIANGDKAVIESYGFTTSSDSRKKAVVPDVPAAAKISGNAAALHLQITAVAGAVSYCWVIFTGEAGNATVSDTHIVLTSAAVVLPDGTARETLRNAITPGTRITVQLLAQNAAGKSAFSPAVTFTVGS